MSEEDEEQEADATERLRNELGEKFETETNNNNKTNTSQIEGYLSSALTIMNSKSFTH